MAVVNNIKEIREQRGIYQDELAEATGYCTKTIGQDRTWGNSPSAEFMLRISKYFNMMVEDVFHVEIESEQQSGSPSILDIFSYPYQQQR